MNTHRKYVQIMPSKNQSVVYFSVDISSFTILQITPDAHRKLLVKTISKFSSLLTIQKFIDKARQGL